MLGQARQTEYINVRLVAIRCGPTSASVKRFRYGIVFSVNIFRKYIFLIGTHVKFLFSASCEHIYNVNRTIYLIMAFFNKGAGRLALYGLGYIIFLILGALVFSAIETPEELDLIQKLRTERASFLNKHKCVEDDELESLITEIVLASNRGVSAVKNASGTPNWSFGQSLFFSSTVITTIGYGHVTPLSRSGKIFCVLYATVGIPLTLVLLSALVERLLVPTVWFLQFLNARLGHLYQPLNIRLFHLFIIVSFFVIFFLLIPATIFATCEPEWDYLDSFYYCFISLTTIGLGDYIPGDSINQPNRPIYKIVTAAYLFVGITFMMLTLAVFYDIPQLNLGMLFSTSTDVNSEKVRLAGSSTGSQYGAGDVFTATTADDNTHRHVVRVRSRRDDSPSPEESGPKELRLP